MRRQIHAVQPRQLRHGLVFLRVYRRYRLNFRVLGAFGPSGDRDVGRRYPGRNRQGKTSHLYIMIMISNILCQWVGKKLLCIIGC